MCQDVLYSLPQTLVAELHAYAAWHPQSTQNPHDEQLDAAPRGTDNTTPSDIPSSDAAGDAATENASEGTALVQDANSSNARALLTLRSASVLAEALQNTRGLLAWIGLGSALLLTGNLAACLAAATVQEAWVLVCIRLRYEAVVRVLQQQMAELRESQREFDQLLR